jgi:cysteinyl-tRNA synthetase
VTSFPQIEECERRVEYLYATQLRVSGFPASRIDAQNKAVDPHLQGFRARLCDVLNDDLNLPQALSVVADLLKRINEALDLALRKQNRLSAVTHACMQEQLAVLGRVLGLGEGDGAALLARVRARRVKALGLTEAAIEGKIAERIAARTARDFARADALRDELVGLGIELMDAGDVTHWRVA